MEIIRLNNIFSEEQLLVLNNAIDEASEDVMESPTENSNLGRVSYRIGPFHFYYESLFNKISHLTGSRLEMKGANAVEYNLKYGQPNLPPHVDRDNTELLVNFQLSSNTKWGIGLDEEVFYIEDNEALIFNPNENIHWRPRKEFQPGEFVRMMFFRFVDSNNEIDNSHLPSNMTDSMFDLANKARDQIGPSLI